MPEPGFDTIFDELIEGNEGQQRFLEALVDLLPGAAAAFCADGQATCFAGVPLAQEGDVAVDLARQAEKSQGLVSRQSGDNLHLYATPVTALGGQVVIQLGGEVDLAGAPVTARLLANTVRLALMQQEHEELAAEKEQFVKQITILKHQHGRLIEDNYRQYRRNQEKEKEYARKLEQEIAQQTAELREANARLAEISRLKSDFLANMSHELRTPMNAIIGFTELLAETSLDEEQVEYARTIRQSALSLLALINDILDLAKIEAGKLELEDIPYELAETVESVVAMFRLAARKKGVALRQEIDPRLPARLQGDGNRLRQILINLVGNAMKFTDQGEVAIRVRCLGPLPEGDGVEARFEVRDTGIGIPPDRKEAIFEKFTQADGSTTRKYGGTGLGLSICQQLVELMGGAIGVESEVGKGSTFFFTIPCRPAAEAQGPQPAAGAGEARRSPAVKGRILLVEDNAVNQKLARILISKQGHRVEVAADGLEALEMLRKEEFDLVLMDVQMPRMDGLTATREIRKIEADPGQRQRYAGLKKRSSPLKIIGLTAHARREDERTCYEAGMDGFLTKPIVKDKLAAALNAVLAPDGG